jgi:hypothetical protein
MSQELQHVGELSEAELGVLAELVETNNAIRDRAQNDLSLIQNRIRDLYILLDDRYDTNILNGVHVIANDGKIIVNPEPNATELPAE